METRHTPAGFPTSDGRQAQIIADLQQRLQQVETARNPCACSAFNSIDQTLPTNIWTKVNLDSIAVGNTNLFDTTNHYYVVPVSGLYWIFGSVLMESSTIASTLIAGLWQNGMATQLAEGNRQVTGYSGVAAYGASVGRLIYTTSGTKIELAGFSNGAAGKFYSGLCVLNAFKVG